MKTSKRRKWCKRRPINQSGFTLPQVMISLGVLMAVTLLSARQFGQMGKFQAFFGSGQDAAVLQDDLRQILNDPLRCLESVKPAGRGQFSERPDEITVALPGGDTIGTGKPLARYSVKDARVKVISSREVFHHLKRHERVWALDMDLVGNRSTGEAMKPRPLGTIFIRLDEQRNIQACSNESRGLMRCESNELLQVNYDTKMYECVDPVPVASKDGFYCPPGMRMDPQDPGRSCIRDERSPTESRAIELTSSLQRMMKNPSEMLDPKNLQKLTENLKSQLQDVCLQSGGQWTETGCHK